jgi:hypothetical protein
MHVPAKPLPLQFEIPAQLATAAPPLVYPEPELVMWIALIPFVNVADPFNAQFPSISTDE